MHWSDTVVLVLGLGCEDIKHAAGLAHPQPALMLRPLSGSCSSSSVSFSCQSSGRRGQALCQMWGWTHPLQKSLTEREHSLEVLDLYHYYTCRRTTLCDCAWQVLRSVFTKKGKMNSDSRIVNQNAVIAIMELTILHNIQKQPDNALDSFQWVDGNMSWWSYILVPVLQFCLVMESWGWRYNGSSPILWALLESVEGLRCTPRFPKVSPPIIPGPSSTVKRPLGYVGTKGRISILWAGVIKSENLRQFEVYAFKDFQRIHKLWMTGWYPLLWKILIETICIGQISSVLFSQAHLLSHLLIQNTSQTHKAATQDQGTSQSEDGGGKNNQESSKWNCLFIFSHLLYLSCLYLSLLHPSLSFFSRSLSFSLSLSPAPGPSGPGASFTRPFCPAGGPPEGTARGGRFPGIFTVTRSRSISLPWTFCMYSCRVKGQRSQTASDRTLSNAGTYSDSQILSSLLFSKPSGEKFKIA